jgi:two-component system phosphate regulon sensor histidine kinase PhoR
MTRTLITSALYFVPTMVLSSLGILILVFQRAGFDIVFGILILILSVALLTGGIIVHGVVRSQARRAKLQTDFVAKVSHELRTPLASIRMFVDTLQDGVKDPDETALCLNVISSETSRLTSMIERLLSWGRMEAGRRIYDKHPELASTLVGEALAQLEPQLQRTEVKIELDLPEESPAVLADRQAIVETLLNLLSNALKYGTKDNKGTITIRVQTLKKKRVRIIVEDSGAGIPQKEQRRIFERFYRGNSQVVNQIQGSGLGLAMAQLVIKAHKGKIKVRSRPDEGASFIISLRRLRPDKLPMEVPPG